MHEPHDKLVALPILAVPYNEDSFTLETNACNDQVGRILLQEQHEGITKLVGYWFQSLTKANQAYDTTQPEYFALAWSVLILRAYLQGICFTIQTDHPSLIWILILADATDGLTRWRLRLSEFKSDVIHCAGI